MVKSVSMRLTIRHLRRWFPRSSWTATFLFCARIRTMNHPPHPPFGHPLPLGGGEGRGTAVELSRNGFLPLLIVILLLISKNLSRARLRLGLRLGACPCGRATGLISMAVLPGGEGWGEGEGDARAANRVGTSAEVCGSPAGPFGFEPFILSCLRLCRRSLTKSEGMTNPE